MNYRECKVDYIWFVGSNIYVIVLKEYFFLDFWYYWKLNLNGDFIFIIKGVKFNCRKLENLKNIIDIICDFIL